LAPSAEKLISVWKSVVDASAAVGVSAVVAGSVAAGASVAVAASAVVAGSVAADASVSPTCRKDPPRQKVTPHGRHPLANLWVVGRRICGWSAECRPVAAMTIEADRMRSRVEGTGCDQADVLQAADPSHGCQAGSASSLSHSRPEPILRGLAGTKGSDQPISSSRRSAFFALHLEQQATQFSQQCNPPRLRGMTWSIVSPALRQ